MQIEIDFEVFKELTARRTHEGHTYNEVLRDVLGLKPSFGRQGSDTPGSLDNPKKTRVSFIAVASSWRERNSERSIRALNIER